MAGNKIGFDASGDLAIATSDILANAVTTPKIADGAVDDSQLATGAVSAIKIASSTITGAEMAAGAVGPTQLAANAVTSSKILAGAVSTSKILANAVTTATIAAGAVEASDLSNVVADQIGGLEITKTAEGTPGADDIEIVVQAKDVQGNNLSARVLIDIWISTIDFASPAAIASFNDVSGTLVEEVVAEAHLRMLTQSSGSIKVRANPGSGAFTRFIMASTGPVAVSIQADWSA